MTSIEQQYVAFIEGVCNSCNMPDAIKPLTEGFMALIEENPQFEAIGGFDPRFMSYNDLIWNLIYSYDTCEDEDEDEESAYENGQYWGYYFETEYTVDQLEEIYKNDYGFDSFDDFVEKFGGKEVE